MQTKATALQDCSIKFAPSQGVFSGYGSVFGVVDSHKEIVMPGAFSKVLKSSEPVHVYVNHGWLNGDLPVGRWADLKEDAKGLFGDANLQMQMPSAVDAYWAVKGELVSGLSIGYIPDETSIVTRQDGVKEIHRIKKLGEISIVTRPSNVYAQVTDVKSAEFIRVIQEAKTVRELEGVLRDVAGLPKAVAAALVARVKTVVALGDPGLAPPMPVFLSQIAQKLKTIETLGA